MLGLPLISLMTDGLNVGAFPTLPPLGCLYPCLSTPVHYPFAAAMHKLVLCNRMLYSSPLQLRSSLCKRWYSHSFSLVVVLDSPSKQSCYVAATGMTKQAPVPSIMVMPLRSRACHDHDLDSSATPERHLQHRLLSKHSNMATSCLLRHERLVSDQCALMCACIE
jgi:hypothetical protein